MSGAKKIIYTAAAIILAAALLFLAFVGGMLIFIRANIDYTVDDALFESSELGGTRLLAYDNELSQYTECEVLRQNGLKKVKYPLSEISDYLKSGFIAMEDRKFYSHSGVDYKRTVGATLNYLFKREKIYGASTITQQVVKNISGDSEVKISRKIAEIIRARHMEHRRSKDEILELYLNIVPYTDNTVGVGAASRLYFGKEPSELSLAEAATLVGITNSPAKYNPYKHPDACIQKRNRVLFAMLEFGVIEEGEYEAALTEELTLQPKTAPRYNSWFAETVISDVTADLVKKYSITEQSARLLIMGGGYDIYTTESPEIQAALERIFSDSESFPSAVSSGLNYSFVITDSKSGNLLAIYGAAGEKRGERLLNYATVNLTPGSVLKPLALYAPLIDARRISWATVFDDYPTDISELDGGKYKLYPHNYPDVYDGLIPVHTALEKSKNTVAIRLYQMLGSENIYRNLKDSFGFDTLVRRAYNKEGNQITDLAPAPLALGQLSYGISLRKLTAAYTVFPNDGVYNECRSYTAVLGADGRMLLENGGESKRVLGTHCARIMNKLLEGVVTSGTARSITLGGVVDTAGKTGTSGGDRDRLFIGYTPYLTAGIWCGYGGGHEIGSLSPSHLEIWDRVMLSAHEIILKNNEAPEGFSTEGLLYLPYCRDSGGLYTEICSHDLRGERIEYGYFEAENAPSVECARHILCPKEYYGGEASEGTDLVAMLYIPERRGNIPTADAPYAYTSEALPYADGGPSIADFIYRRRRMRQN